MRFTARVSGTDRFARRLSAIASAPPRARVLDEAAAMAADAARAALVGSGRRAPQAEIRVVPRGPVSREVTIEGRGLWSLEYGSRARPGSGALTRALADATHRIRQSIARRTAEAWSRAGRISRSGREADGDPA
jgi:hypothetical protein